MATKKNPFAGKGKDDVMASYQYINKDGNYYVRLDNCKIGRNRKKRELAFIEVTILKVLSDEAEHKVGQTVSKAVGLDNDYLMTDITDLLKAAIGEHVMELSDEELTELCWEMFPHVDEGGQSPLKNIVLELQSWEQEKQDGDPFTKVKWSSGPPVEKLPDILGQETLDRFFPPDVYEGMLKAEQTTA